ncbi:AAA family ATPase [Paenibacillus agricola]|uniref:AAA family ATPase n=1 Tax=Paenibacillus agricola TaxID=2716264 RepID=A0ABX0JBW1_9BACL|nr:AAA family ATPase [Paenibacillus agricola]NHN31185.1 AAA family ATPase [Paenibacillus agricola]
MSVGETLLSKIIDANDVPALLRYQIAESDFPTVTERSASAFILDYADKNGGQAPSYATVVTEVPDFVYIPAVTDSYEYLTGKLKDGAGKRILAELINGSMAKKYAELSAGSFITWFTKELERVKMGTSVPLPIGKTLADRAVEFRAEYDKRKAGASFKLWKTPFPTLNAEIGGLYSGDIYGIMAESGRGKTYLSAVLIDEMLRQGAKVLVKSYEVKAYVWLARLFSIMTARDEAVSHADHAVKVGLPNKAILSGHLDDEMEPYFFAMLDAINEYYPGELILQAKSDTELTRTLADLDRELHIRPDIDCVVIDPFYGLDDVYGHNANKTAGGAAEQAARHFERIIGAHDVVGIFTIQASTERQETDEGTGHREIKLPKRDQVKTTKALLEIATNLFVFDAVDGNGRIGVEKGRNGGEGFTLDLVALMDYGVLREMPTGAEVAAQFLA